MRGVVIHPTRDQRPEPPWNDREVTRRTLEEAAVKAAEILPTLSNQNARRMVNTMFKAVEDAMKVNGERSRQIEAWLDAGYAPEPADVDWLIASPSRAADAVLACRKRSGLTARDFGWALLDVAQGRYLFTRDSADRYLDFHMQSLRNWRLGKDSVDRPTVVAALLLAGFTNARQAIALPDDALEAV